MTNEPMNNEQLFRVAPSIFATQPWEGMSARYAFIPTIDIVEKMRTEGFRPFSATQAKCRIDGKKEFTKHLIRFRQEGGPVMQSLGGLFPEIVLTNSHDGASSYRVDAGCWRSVCINGLICGDSIGEQIKVRHTGNPDGIIEASYQVVKEFPNVLASVEAMAQLRLSSGEREAFGAAALELRYDEKTAPVEPSALVRPRRTADSEPSLWNTFNVVQENLTQGGLRGRNPETRARLRTRAVTGISENTKLNKALWTLTEKMRELIGGGSQAVAA